MLLRELRNPHPRVIVVCPVRLRQVSRTSRARQRARAGSREERDESLLDKAAADFAKGLESGLTADEIMAAQLGLDDSGELSEVQEKYKNEMKQKLLERAEEIQMQQREDKKSLELGKLAYSRGQYAMACNLFEEAAKKVGKHTRSGGEAQLWLALAYQAVGKEQQCIALYKDMKENHECSAIRKQAADLLFIMEAPKLEISDDEKVKIPLLSNLEKTTGRAKYAARPSAAQLKKRKYEKTFEEKFWEDYKPPIYAPNNYVWIASAIVMLCVAWYSTTLRGMGKG